jgi:hypothetical protein
LHKFKEEGRRKKEEGRRKKEEGRRKKPLTGSQAEPGNKYDATNSALPGRTWERL